MKILRKTYRAPMNLKGMEKELRRLEQKQGRDERKIRNVRSSPITVRAARELIDMRAKQIEDLKDRIAQVRALEAKEETPV